LDDPNGHKEKRSIDLYTAGGIREKASLAKTFVYELCMHTYIHIRTYLPIYFMYILNIYKYPERVLPILRDAFMASIGTFIPSK